MQPPTTSRSRISIWVLGAALVVLVPGLTATLVLAAAGADALPTPGWDLIKSLTWPGATVAVLLFSPVSRAIADWIQSYVRPPAARAAGPTPGGNDRERELQAMMESMTELLQEMATVVKRSAEVQTKTVEALQEIQRGLAILLDRTPRAGGMVS